MDKEYHLQIHSSDTCGAIDGFDTEDQNNNNNRHSPYDVEASTQPMNYKCGYCDFTSVTLYNVQAHIAESHSKDPEGPASKCHHCGTECGRSPLQCQQRHPGQSSSYSKALKLQCQFCLRDFLTIQGLRRHLLNYHSDQNVQPMRNVQNIQPAAAAAAASNTTSTQHINLSSGDQITYKCKFCYFCTLNLQELKGHVLNRHFRKGWGRGGVEAQDSFNIQSLLFDPKDLRTCSECRQVFETPRLLHAHLLGY